MTEPKIAELERRGVVAVGGSDAQAFLDNLITTNVDNSGAATFGGLLSPQGKLLFDFIVLKQGDRYLLDVARREVGALLKRLTMFKLRADITIDDLSEDRIVVAAWGRDEPPTLDGPVVRDPRHSELGFRGIVPPGADMAPDYAEAMMADYDRHRLSLGIPEAGVDFAFGDVFPHDADMDQLTGVDFAKGCFVGQEVVSRMKHRGTARRRIVRVSGASLPPVDTPLTAGGKAIGAMGSSANDKGLALVRLDRASEAMGTGTPILAGETPVALTIPPWADFDWPSE